MRKVLSAFELPGRVTPSTSRLDSILGQLCLYQDKQSEYQYQEVHNRLTVERSKEINRKQKFQQTKKPSKSQLELTHLARV